MNLENIIVFAIFVLMITTFLKRDDPDKRS
jgi:hypothetical protein